MDKAATGNGREARSGSVVGTAMVVLQCFGPRDPELGVVEIAERVGLHKSSVSRLMTTLETEGLVERDPVSRKYRLGLALLSVSGTLLADLDVRRAAYPVLADLAHTTHESCSLMLWSRDQAVCVEQVNSDQAIKHTTAIGTTYRSTANSSVRIFLAYMLDDHVEELISQGFVPLHGDTDLPALRSDLASVRRKGCAVNDGQTDPSEVGVSAMVHDHRGEPIAAVLISAPRFRVDSPCLDHLVSQCREAADRITTSLGGTPQHG